MVKGSAGSIARQIKTLWTAGTIGEADDPALLALFSTRRDEAGDAAFRILVERHGPMVVRVCRQVLGDDHDSHDAAQAVFLVLARKAGSIRHRGSIAPWLHSVACRVALRARRQLALRRLNETRAVSARVQSIAAECPPSVDWQAIHDEVARLPEKYRAPVVLCYLEGQTYEETARRLGCPVGTVRVRLSRARDRLRDRLQRRGFGPATFLPLPLSETTSSLWIESTVQAARLIIKGRALEAGTVSASALALSQGVLWSMTLTKMKLAACGMLVIGSLAAGGTALVGQELAPRVSTPAAFKNTTDSDPLPDREREIALRFANAARQRVEAQWRLFFGGEITLNRYVDASRLGMEADTRLSRNRSERIAAAQAHLKRMSELVELVNASVEKGSGTKADLAEAQAAHDQADLDVIDAPKSAGPRDYEALERRVKALEGELDRVIKLLDIIAPGRDDARERGKVRLR